MAEYLKTNGIDVYLDTLDAGLQKATEENKAQDIVECVHKALKYSTDILVLVSDKTQASWWVPYEVGYAKHAKKLIASAVLNGCVENFPDFLKIEKTIESANEFKEYALEIKGREKEYEALLESVSEPIELEQYIKTII